MRAFLRVCLRLYVFVITCIYCFGIFKTIQNIRSYAVIIPSKVFLLMLKHKVIIIRMMTPQKSRLRIHDARLYYVPFKVSYFSSS